MDCRDVGVKFDVAECSSCVVVEQENVRVWIGDSEVVDLHKVSVHCGSVVKVYFVACVGKVV